MRVLFVSRCSKKALVETRRILDQFAERCGDCVWQTQITQQGLDMVRRLLRKTARKNTAVACHWLRGHVNEEVVWMVGDVSRFNERGIIPTNTTKRDIINSSRENSWNIIEDVALLAGLAGLFHDFGKANAMFQKKLINAEASSEPFRHEWVSLLMFTALVGDLSDAEWLEKLTRVSEADEADMLARLEGSRHREASPFKKLPPLARVVAWLILSHHRLPHWPNRDDDSRAPKWRYIDEWLSDDLTACWNSPQCETKSWTAEHRKEVFSFRGGTPIRSEVWRARAHQLASRAFQRQSLIQDWMAKGPLTMHLARMVLMFADHCYSSKRPTLKWQDPNLTLHANTDKISKSLKQKLDEHNVGVAVTVRRFAQQLPALRDSLPSISRLKALKKRSQKPQFAWQDKAYDMAVALKDRAERQGFFGINMASTGCGKTLANAKIIYGLTPEHRGCRFNVALGLRTLTLQTGDALRSRLGLSQEDLAILIGSSAVKKLHEMNSQKGSENRNGEREFNSSESEAELWDDAVYLHYDGVIDDGILSKWLARDPRLHQLLSAPIVVSTIDQLIAATESQRGGKQIAPMLRLITSDLIIDEPDDFDLNDLPALCRLVNWAGMLGSYVLISSATLPPALVKAMFEAYQAGWNQFRECCLEPGPLSGICTAWFDEHDCRCEENHTSTEFMESHRGFVEDRVAKLKTQVVVRKGKIVVVEREDACRSDFSATAQQMAKAICPSIVELHNAHAISCESDGARLSIGLVRMANINPLVATAKALLRTPPPEGYHIHYCIYHSRHPLLIRSEIERCLDQVLARHDPRAIWTHPSVKIALAQHPASNHVFVILASPVAEVGRDHDYDWAIVEPSSMRSIIQIAGRVRRHRAPEAVLEANLHILDYTFRGLRGKRPVFSRPGFESKSKNLISARISDLLASEQISRIDATPRIQDQLYTPSTFTHNLAAFEHERTHETLFENDPEPCYAARWWEHGVHWSYELQRQTLFRKSSAQLDYYLFMEDFDANPEFWLEDEHQGKRDNETFKRICDPDLRIANGVSCWLSFDYPDEIRRLAESLELPTAVVSRRFGTLQLYPAEQNWIYHPALGVHQEPME